MNPAADAIPDFVCSEDQNAFDDIIPNLINASRFRGTHVIHNFIHQKELKSLRKPQKKNKSNCIDLGLF